MKKSVIKATALVFFLSLLAKIVGFLKSIIQASYFGATVYTDAFNVSNGFVSNILYMLTTAIAVAFIPIYIQRKHKDHSEQKFASTIVTAFSLGAVVLTVLLIIIAPIIVKIIAPGYSADEQEITVQYFRVLTLGFIFSLVVSIYTNLLNAEKVYGYSTICSLVNSIVLILSIVLLSKSIGVWALVIAVPMSYFVQWMLLYARGRKYASISFKGGFKDDGIIILAIQALPILLSQATVEINQVVDRALLSSVGEGIVTAVAYSATLYEFAQVVVSTPFSTVMYTELSESAAKGDEPGIKLILRDCYKIFAFVCLPIMAVIFFCKVDIVTLIYGHGNFSGEAIANCAIGLGMYCFCLLPECTKLVLNKAYYALNDTRLPMAIGVAEVALNISLSFILVRRYGIYGVVGATAIASIVFFIVTIIVFNRNHVKVIDRRELFSYWKFCIAAVVMVGLMLFMRNIMFGNCLTDFILKIVIAFAVYSGVLILEKEQTVLSTIRMLVGTIARRK